MLLAISHLLLAVFCATNKKRRPHFCSRLVNSLGLEFSAKARYQRGSAAVKRSLVRKNTTKLTPAQSLQQVQICFVTDMLAYHNKKESLMDACIPIRCSFIVSNSVAHKTKKRRLHFYNRLVNSLGLEPRTPTLKVLCSTC